MKKFLFGGLAIIIGAVAILALKNKDKEGKQTEGEQSSVWVTQEDVA
ncbi:hypothetical protein [Thalassobacillus sp. C254]|nr:hypothetical protein [Thalassobacillus sp. C254]